MVFFTSLVPGALAISTLLATSKDGTTALARDSAGGVVVYLRSGSDLVAQVIITNPRAHANSRFANSAVFSDDGDTLLIADYITPVGGTPSAGAVYAYSRSGGAWSQEGALVASDAATDDQFGISITLAGDGNTALIGANTKNSKTGAAYVFTRSGGVWSEQQKLTASDGAAEDSFGAALALAGTLGDTALIGATGADTSATNVGAAYVFTRSGTTWSEQQKLTASDEAKNDSFGSSVALASDGETALIGAAGVDTGVLTNTGAGYVFQKNAGVWSEQTKLTVPSAPASVEYGVTALLSADGTTALLGGWTQYENTARTFTESGGAWSDAGTYSYASIYLDSFLGNHISGGSSYFLSGATIAAGSSTCVFDDDNFGECVVN